MRFVVGILAICGLAFTTCQAHCDTKGSQRIVIFKRQRLLILYRGTAEVSRCKIALGSNPIGTKFKKGDYRTPEGTYFITHKNPKSRFFLSLGISYPGIQDAARGLAAGTINQGLHDQIVLAIHHRQIPPQNTALGGDIFIHGGGSLKDWTWGCIALARKDIAALFKSVSIGTVVVIRK